MKLLSDILPHVLTCMTAVVEQAREQLRYLSVLQAAIVTRMLLRQPPVAPKTLLAASQSYLAKMSSASTL